MMKRTFRMTSIVPALVIVSLILAACGDALPGSSGSLSGANPSPQLKLEEADQVAQTFLTAWQDADYPAMYGLISPNSRDAYNEESFASEYQSIATTMTLTGLSATITNSLRQGTTAAIMHDIVFETELFGQITDTGRTLRLIETPEGWRVAWSRMDIFAELAEGARLEFSRTMPGRGNIYDRDGDVLVAQNGRTVTLYLVKQNIPNEAECIDALSLILRKERDSLEAMFAQFYPETRFLVGELDPETYQAQEPTLLQLCAVEAGTRNTRRYVGELAPHVVGYVGQIQPDQVAEYEARGYDAGALIGQEGIERAFERELAGKIGGRLVITAPTGETLRLLGEAPAEPGQSVYLTLDRDLQAAVQDAFIEAYNQAGPTWSQTSPGGAAVVMNVKTGEILAMVSYPWFDPSLFNPDSPVLNRGDAITALRNSPRTPMFNRAMRGLYPLGSVFKIVSLATALSSGVYSPNQTTMCTGTWYGGERGDALPYRTDWNPSGHGLVNASTGLTYSCNPYFWDVGIALHNADPEMLPTYTEMMGLGVPTGQEVLPEDTGYIPDPEMHFRLNGTRWTMADTLNLVIGQGQMQITPLQVVRMTAAIANGGTLYAPQFVSKVQLIGEQPSYVAQPTASGVLDFDPSVFELIQEAMCNVTLDPNGTARYIYDTWYEYQASNGFNVTVCGKTGTAQTGSEGVKPQAWFTAFVPREDPEIAITVIVENSCEGSEVASPIVRRIVEDYYGMPHSTWPELWQTGCLNLGE